MKRIRLPRIERDRFLESMGFGVLAVGVGLGVGLAAGLVVAGLALIVVSFTLSDDHSA